MPFLDDIPIKGSLEEEKDGSKDEPGCRSFVIDHIKDCEKVLQKLERRKPRAFRSEVHIWETRSFGHRTLVWSIWTEIVSNQSGCYPKDEGRTYIPDRGVKILGSLCIQSYMDSTLCSCH